MASEPEQPQPRSAAEAALYDLLRAQGIAVQTVEHEAVFTVEQSASIKTSLPGGHTKNLFLTNKDGEFVLVCAWAQSEIKINRLHRALGMKRFSFGKADALQDLLGVLPGSVTLFSVLNDTKGKVRLVLDKALFNHKTVWFHPLRNTASTAISAEDIEKFAKATGHHPMTIDFGALLTEET